MLAVAPLRDTCRDENQGEVERFSIGHSVVGEDLPDFGDGNLLDSIDFDDLFIGINVDGDVLPDLEMDPELLADFSASVSGGEEYSDMNTSSASAAAAAADAAVHQKLEDVIEATKKEDDDKVSGTTSGSAGSTTTRGDQEIISKREDERVGSRNNTISQKDSRKSSSSSAQSKNSQGKRKVKVDWTPELHRRFVQAVEQLGVDKAVPSRILELMGIDCLTRHNIASHLQKYRSHRKHLLAREAEAASWTQRRQMYGSVATITAGGGVPKREMNPWIAPTMGFPPITPMHHHHPPHHFRPLHVWGHPTMDQSLMHMWPKHSPSPPPPPPPTVWPPAPPPLDPSYWNHPHNHQRVPNALTPGTPCFPQPLAPTRFGALPVPGIPPHATYKVDPGIGAPTATEQSGPVPPLFDFHPSKESVDAAIEDVLSKPWLPLPLGLKPPSLDSVMGELQRQGVPKIPPSSSSSCSTA